MMELPDSRVVFTSNEISEAVARLAEDVTDRCRGREWLAVCVMHGALIFTAALMLRLPIQLKQDQVRATRYRESVTGGKLEWLVFPEADLDGRNILLIDDIFDEGHTLAEISEEFKERGASQVVSVVLLEKVHDRKVEGYRPDLVGLTCGDRYVFGYGMDMAGYWRNLPEIRELLA